MSQSKLYGIQSGSLIPGPTLQVVRQSDGLVTASMSFTCRKFEYASSSIQSKLNQGTTLVSLYPQCGSDFQGLYLDEWDAQDAPGGWTTVTCRFKGIVASTTSEFSNDKNVTYTRNNSLQDDSIFNSPSFKREVSSASTQTPATIRMGVQGACYKDPKSPSGEYWIRKSGTNELIETITSEDFQWWWDHIVTNGNTTYLSPHSEWTKSATATAKLRASDMDKFGFIDDSVPGSPAPPDGHKWLYTGATESITVEGDTVNSYSQTWTSGDWEEKLYNKV